ncbi:MAG: hypothetical protein QOI11_2032 [Candidatus Eremiobacteraeota bacterium]|nr:hypothetical protein [Candidatus Eremiobacteraeota bacterium]
MPATKARTKTTGRVKGARGGADHPAGEPAKTKRASSRTRAAEAGEPLTKKAAAARKKPATDITDGDVAKVPSLARARARDTGANSG